MLQAGILKREPVLCGFRGTAGFTREGEKGVGLCSGQQEFPCSTFCQWNELLSPIPDVGDTREDH